MNRNRFRAAFGAAAITATLLASGAGVSPASAADHGSQSSHDASKSSKVDKEKSGKGKGKGKGEGKGKGKGGDNKGGPGSSDDKDAQKLAKAIVKLDAAFAKRLTRTEKLGEASQAQVAANIASDRAMLAQLTTVEDVRALQPENYDQVIALLRSVERLVADVEAPDAAITAAVTAVTDQLLAITATSDKSALRTAKDLLGVLEELVEAAQEGVDEGDDTGDDTGDDSGTGDTGSGDAGTGEPGGETGGDAGA